MTRTKGKMLAMTLSSPEQAMEVIKDFLDLAETAVKTLAAIEVMLEGGKTATAKEVASKGATALASQTEKIVSSIQVQIPTELMDKVAEFVQQIQDSGDDIDIKEKAREFASRPDVNEMVASTVKTMQHLMGGTECTCKECMAERRKQPCYNN